MTPLGTADTEDLVRELIRRIGDDPDRQGLLDTPKRVVRSWRELFGGYSEDCSAHSRTFTADCDDVVIVDGIDFYSTCEHHMLPFHGHAAVAYVPSDGQVLGVSKVVRLVNAKARRLQIQERIGREVADAIEHACPTKGVMVVLEATHLCMVARGVKQHHSVMRTSRATGCFRNDDKARAEALALMNLGVRDA
jgi:GTP cyclohydrolase I